MPFAGVLGGDHTWHHELVVVREHAQPKADLLSGKLTFAHGATLDERGRTEVFQAASGTLEGLTASLSTRTTMLNKKQNYHIVFL